MRAGLSLPPQERRHVLLHVRTAAEPFVRYENARQQQHSPSPASPILRPLDNGSEATFHEMESARSKRMEDDEAEEEEEEEQEEDLCLNEHGRPCLLLPGQPLSLSLSQQNETTEGKNRMMRQRREQGKGSL